jgi:hypothetical protein
MQIGAHLFALARVSLKKTRQRLVLVVCPIAHDPCRRTTTGDRPKSTRLCGLFN